MDKRDTGMVDIISTSLLPVFQKKKNFSIYNLRQPLFVKNWDFKRDKTNLSKRKESVGVVSNFKDHELA